MAGNFQKKLKMAHLELTAVEPEGVDTGAILRIVYGLIGILAVIIIFVFGWMNLEFNKAEVAAIAHADYSDLREVRARGAQLLNNPEAIDLDAGTYRIDIDRAMDLMVYEAYDEHANRTYSDELPLLPQQ